MAWMSLFSLLLLLAMSVEGKESRQDEVSAGQDAFTAGVELLEKMAEALRFDRANEFFAVSKKSLSKGRLAWLKKPLRWLKFLFKKSSRSKCKKSLKSEECRKLAKRMVMMHAHRLEKMGEALGADSEQSQGTVLGARPYW